MLNRVLLVFLVLAVVAMAVLGLVSSAVLRDSLENLSKERLSDAAELVASELAVGVAPPEAARNAASAFTSDSHSVRVTLIARDGTVVAETDADPANLDNHLFRPEVAQALASRGTAWDTRYSSTLGMTMLYFASYDEGKDLVIRTSLPLSELDAATSRLTGRIALVAIGLLLLFLAVGILSIRMISRPLVEMKTVAAAISEGRYDLRVHRVLGDRSSIGRLALAFNAMAERLQTSTADLEDKTCRMDAVLDVMDAPLLSVDGSLQVTFRNAAARHRFGPESDDGNRGLPLVLAVRSRSVEDSVRACLRDGARTEMEWRQETDQGVVNWRVTASPLAGRDGGALVVFQDMTEILRLQRIRSDFAANVTHELSTPLTAIRGFVETLRAGASKDPATAARFLDIIDVEAERLHRLIDDILTLSEIEGGRVKTEPTPFDMNERIDRTVVLLGEVAAKRGVRLVAGPPRGDGESVPEEPEEPERLDVQADPDRIGQLLVNLIDNAIKYNRPDGSVWAWAERARDGRIRLHVKDTGIGIADEHKPRVFERFYRVDAGRSRETGGTGLGLSIVKHIAMLYDGHVDIESEPGEGSEFIVTLGI